MMEKKQRIQSIDALRGLAVVLMVIHHFLYDLCAFLGAPWWLFSNPVFNFLHYIFAGLFIFLSGVSSRFSRSNIKRGIIVIAVAMVITLVTWFMDMPVRFGVLHLLGFCMLFYGITHKLWESIPAKLMPVLCVMLLVISALAVKFIPIESEHLWMFGWVTPDFYSSDYFPIFPWIFVFLFGTWAGKYIREGRLPEKFYTFNMPILPQIGRKALIIYILHQPVLYGLTILIRSVIR
ncbi:MAG: heparan-alpha-glucosaminide N-acetyltransferase [Clostridiales bacterium]|nr:heparan-alpha-glucosaminide N-acetyltransferase [Clostridiales bacterium]